MECSGSGIGSLKAKVREVLKPNGAITADKRSVTGDSSYVSPIVLLTSEFAAIYKPPLSNKG
jgi:hypothetical protein